MLGAFLRRKTAATPSTVQLPPADDESILFSLTTQVPRPMAAAPDQAAAEHLPEAKLVTAAGDQLCRIRNISAGGLTADVLTPQEVGSQVSIELDSERTLSGQVVWTREGSAGVKFDDDVDLGLLFASGSIEGEIRARPPRLEVTCGATVQIGRLYHRAEVRDISLGGMKIALKETNCDVKHVKVMVETLRPVRGSVRWYRDGYAGIVFDEPFTFDELAEWLAKRLELATLRTAAIERIGS